MAAESLDDIQRRPYEFTPAMEVMRGDMESGINQDVTRIIAQERASRGDPELENVLKVKDVMDDIFGKGSGLSTDGLFDSQVTEAAHGVIHDGPQDFTLSIKQWQQVQNLVEAGIRLGWQKGRDSRG